MANIVPAGLTSRHVIVLELIGKGHDSEFICKKLDIKESTFKNFFKNKIFKSVLKDQYSIAVTATNMRLANLMKKAITNLDTMLDSFDPEIVLKAIGEVRKLVKQNQEMELKDQGNGEWETEVTKIENIDPDTGEVMSIQEQKKVVRRMRELKNNSATETEDIQYNEVEKFNEEEILNTEIIDIKKEDTIEQKREKQTEIII